MFAQRVTYRERRHGIDGCDECALRLGHVPDVERSGVRDHRRARTRRPRAPAHARRHGRVPAPALRLQVVGARNTAEEQEHLAKSRAMGTLTAACLLLLIAGFVLERTSLAAGGGARGVPRCRRSPAGSSRCARRCAALARSALRRQPADDPRCGRRGRDRLRHRSRGADVPVLAQQHARGLHHGAHATRAARAAQAASGARSCAAAGARSRSRPNRSRSARRVIVKPGEAIPVDGTVVLRRIAGRPEQPDRRVGAGAKGDRRPRVRRHAQPAGRDRGAHHARARATRRSPASSRWSRRRRSRSRAPRRSPSGRAATTRSR